MRQVGTKNLTWTQRLQIETLLNAKHSKKEIAKIIGVSLVTIYNELKKGAYQKLDAKTYDYLTSYSAEISQNRYDYKCTAKGAPLKIGNDYELMNYIEKRVAKDKLSPGAVLGEIKRKQLPFKTTITKATLYRYIKLGLFENITIQKRETKYKKIKAKRAPKGTSIEKRPLEINKRTSFGHWEMDCVCGPTKATLLVLSERLTRKEIIMPMKDQKANSVIKCLNSLERQYGKLFRKVFKTITVDNGSEFSNFSGIEKSSYGGKRTSVFYCHPYCSSERGTNERLNREIRRLIPKGSNLAKYSVADIQEVENWVNNYPRQIFDFATSSDLFEEQLKAIC